MEDENADRVYVPGTNPTPPARDVEPFWPPEELDAPVHGGRPVPHDAPPTRPAPAGSDANVYRPMDRAVVPPPPPPPVQRTPAPQPPIPADQGDQPPTQAWPHIGPRTPAPRESTPAAAEPGAEDAEDAAAAVAPDSPWAQPPQRPASVPDDIDIRPLGSRGRATPPPATESQRPAYYPTVTPRRSTENGTAPDSGVNGPVQRPGTDGPVQRPGTDGPVYRPGTDGPVYRPGPVTAESRAGAGGQAAPHSGPHGGSAPTSGAAPRPAPHPQADPDSGPGSVTAPGPQTAQPSATRPVASPTPPVQRPGPAPEFGPAPHQDLRPAPVHEPGPARVQGPEPAPVQPPGPAPRPHPGPARQPGPPPQPGPRVVDQSAPPPGPHATTRPGPFPPTVDPRAMQPHPQVNHASHGAQQPPVPGPQDPPPADPYQQLPWVSDGTPTAEEFARRRVAKPAEPTATMGARALLTKGTMGLVRLAPGKYEREYKQDVEMVRRNFGGLRQVTVVNPKGGAGKTVAVLLLAMTFGQKRGGYVLAWDNNETQGTLGMRAQQDFHARTVRDMMRDLHLFRGSHGRVGDLSQYVRAQGEGMFDVLASDESATAGEMLTASAFAEIREIVSRFYKLIFVDTGNNVRAQNWQAAMDATDQLVITMSARNDSAETAARMLDHLEQSGRQRLVRQAISVVTMPPTRKDIDLPAIQRHFAARTRAVLLAPYEKLIDSGEPIRYGALSNGTRDSWLKIAAAVAEGL